MYHICTEHTHTYIYLFIYLHNISCKLVIWIRHNQTVHEQMN